MTAFDNAIFENYDAPVLAKYWDGNQLYMLDVLKHEECREALKEAIENGFETTEAYYWLVEKEAKDGFYPLPLIFEGGSDADVSEEWKLQLRGAIMAVLDGGV